MSANTSLTKREKVIAADAEYRADDSGIPDSPRPRGNSKAAKDYDALVAQGRAMDAEIEATTDRHIARYLSKRARNSTRPALTELLRDPLLERGVVARIRNVMERRMAVADALVTLLKEVSFARNMGNDDRAEEGLRRVHFLTGRMDDFYWLAVGLAERQKTRPPSTSGRRGGSTRIKRKRVTGL